MKLSAAVPFFLLVPCLLCRGANGRRLATTNATAPPSALSTANARHESGELLATPRLLNNQGLTDIQNILNILTGNNIGATGTVVFIIIAAATAIFWIIIFLIIYYAIFAKKDKEGEHGGGGYGYSPMPSYGYSPMPSYGYGRTLIPDGIINSLSTMAWTALEKLAAKYEFNDIGGKSLFLESKMF